MITCWYSLEIIIFVIIATFLDEKSLRNNLKKEVFYSQLEAQLYRNIYNTSLLKLYFILICMKALAICSNEN